MTHVYADLMFEGVVIRTPGVMDDVNKIKVVIAYPALPAIRVDVVVSVTVIRSWIYLPGIKKKIKKMRN